LPKDTAQVKKVGKVNMVQGQEGWRTPDEAWMEEERKMRRYIL
jgi:hypothetical protein